MILKSKGMWHHVQSQLTDAVTCFEEAKSAYELAELASTPEYAAALDYLGVCCTRQARYDDAMQTFSLSKSAYEAAGMATSSGYATLLRNMGLCQEKLQNQ